MAKKKNVIRPPQGRIVIPLTRRNFPLYSPLLAMVADTVPIKPDSTNLAIFLRLS